MAELQEERTCPICLEVYSNPVSLGCGHSFCEGCIQEVRSRQPNSGGPFPCPQCCAPAKPAAQLQPNAQLRTVREVLDVSAHQEQDKHPGVQCEKKGEDSGQQEEVIPCDFCLQEPQPAVKTCLSCEAALCQAHLGKHSSKRPLKDHVLIEPCGAGVLAERRCPQHGKLLDIYCKTDSVCICLLCFSAGSHKEHQIIALGQAFSQAQNVFPETLKTVKRHEAALKQSISDLLKQEDEVETKERVTRSQLEYLFEELHLQLDNKKGEILKALSDSMEQQLSQIQTQIQEHKEHKDTASHDVQELKALRDQKDPILFTKAFTAIHARKHEPVPNKAHVKLPEPPIIFDESTEDHALKLFQKFLSDLQSLFEAPPVPQPQSLLMYQGDASADSGKASTFLFSTPLPRRFK